MYTSSSGAQSRASSLAEDNEGYVPMHPSSNLPVGEDYMDMQPPASTNSSRTSTRGGDISSATSSCSITSGTPSTDIRFSEYHLDKVQACFTPSEDDDLDRPPRTYSVGSKLEHSKRKLHLDRVVAEHSNPRLRAYSVGSRTIKVTRAELTSLSGSQTSSHNSPVASNHREINNNSSKNKKSSSAPLLMNNFGRTAHGSFDHMDDLMEIDYSSRSSSNLNNISSTPVKSSPVNIPSKPNDDYMNMNSGRHSKGNTPVGGNVSPYVDMRPAGNRRVSENNDDYMDMNRPLGSLRTSNTSSSLSSSPLKSKAVPNSSNYVDMSPRSFDGNTRRNRTISSLSNTNAPSDDYLNMSPVNKSLLEVDLPKRSSIPDGYMEMSYQKSSSTVVDKSNENPSSSSDEYINMDFSNNNDGAGTSDSSSSLKERSTSRPIAIQKRYSSSSNSSRSEKPAKSGSVENGPPAFLPLTNPMTASISPTRSTNRIRCDSRDSGIVTPSSGSQATIFPFSPGSPMKQFDPQEDSSIRKCLVDGTNGVIKLSEDDIIEEEPRTPVPMGMTGLNEKRVEVLSNDYAVMNLGEPVSKKPNLAATPVQTRPPQGHFLLEANSENHDYINCTPNASTSSSKIVTPKPITPTVHNNSSQGDYALMNPIKCSAIASSPGPISDEPPKASSRKSLLLSLSSQEKLNSNSCFKPIVEDDSASKNHQQLYRQISEKTRQSSSDSGYEILARPSLSRPNSVNSEKIKCISSLLNRPSSANSDRLAANSTSSSNSTLCEIRSQNSSSQTLRNMMDTSAVPSPMSVTSRPESVSSDILMASRPPSVTGTERELHYASLDLPQCNTTPQKMEVDQKMDFSTSPSSQQASSSSSSASSQQSQPAFTYAQIDFNRSESLKAHQQQNQSGSKK
jgi:insulin receptor substrate 1